jgi:hypothetical protein
MVVTVPEEPRYLRAPPSQYKKPPPEGLVVGAVVRLLIKTIPPVAPLYPDRNAATLTPFTMA